MRQGAAIFDDLTAEAVECPPGKLPNGWYAINIMALLYRQAADRPVPYSVSLYCPDKLGNPDSWPGILLHASDQLGLAWMILNHLDLHKAADIIKTARGGLGRIGQDDVSDSP